MKRSTSAPLIPELVQAELKQQPPPQANSNLLNRRGISTSNVSLPTEIVIKTTMVERSPRKQPMASPLPLSRINSPTSRVEKLKKEEDIDERKNEKEVREQIQLNKNCNELRIDTEDTDQDFRHEQMEVWPSLPSPSHQPLSPLASRMIRSRSLTPTSPSSTRPFTYRRSCSPVLRPSSLVIQIGRKRVRDHESQEDMDTSPSVPCKRVQLGYPSPLNLSPSISPLMNNNSPLHHSFSTSRSRKSSSTQSESTPLSSPSSLHANPFAVNYDSGNCEHWQSNSGTNSNCSSAGHSPSVGHAASGAGGQKSAEMMSLSLFNSARVQNNLHSAGGSVHNSTFQGGYQAAMQGVMQGSSMHAGLQQGGNHIILQDEASALPAHGHGHSAQFRYLTPSPSLHGATGGEDYKVPTMMESMEMVTDTPTPLSPKGLKFRQKLFPPQNLPSPIPRPHPHTSPTSSTSSSSSPGPAHSGSLIGAPRMSPMTPTSPKSVQQRDHHATSLHHDKHLSPFKSDHLPGRMIRTVAKNRMRHNLISSDPMRTSAPYSGVTGEHFNSAGSRYGAPSAGRYVISGSPLAKLSMSSSLEEGGGMGITSGGNSFTSRGLAKRRTSENSVESSREDCLMESDSDSVNLEESGEVMAPPPSSSPGLQGDKTADMTGF